MLKLKLQYSGHLMPRADSREKTLMPGKTEGKRRGGRQSMRWLMASLTQWTGVWANSRSWWRTGKLGMLQFTGSQKSDATNWLNNSNPLPGTWAGPRSLSGFLWSISLPEEAALNIAHIYLCEFIHSLRAIISGSQRWQDTVSYMPLPPYPVGIRQSQARPPKGLKTMA